MDLLRLIWYRITKALIELLTRIIALFVFIGMMIIYKGNLDKIQNVINKSRLELWKKYGTKGGRFNRR